VFSTVISKIANIICKCSHACVHCSSCVSLLVKRSFALLHGFCCLFAPYFHAASLQLAMQIHVVLLQCPKCGNVVKRAMNRPPQEADCRGRQGKGPDCKDTKCAYHMHQRFCGGDYTKVQRSRLATVSHQTLPHQAPCHLTTPS